MKTTPSVLLAGWLLCSGCLQMGRPPAPAVGDPGFNTPYLGNPANPTQATPRTNSTRPDQPTQVDKPVSPVPATPQKSDGWQESETRKSNSPAQPEGTTPAGEGSDAPKTTEPEPTDAPEWKPLEAPSSSVPSARKAEPQLSQTKSSPGSGSERPTLSEVSRSELSPQGTLSAGWETIAQSTGARPIQAAHAGPDKISAIIIGSLYGNEPESVALIDKLVASSKLMDNQAVGTLIVRTANPDGLAEHIRTNQRGVDLNRNFPSTAFTSIPSQQTGPHPASEAETQLLIQLLRSQAPARVVHVRSTVGSRPLVLMNDSLKGKLVQEALPRHVDWGTFEGGFKAGSLEEFVSVRMSAEMMTILLPPAGFPSLTPEQFLEICLLGTGTPVKDQESLVKAAPVQPETTIQPASTPEVPVKARPASPAIEEVVTRGEKGFVEFLPPPPDALHPDPHAARYYELPPPTP